MSNMYILFALHLLNLDHIPKSVNIFQSSSCLNKKEFLRNFELREKNDRSPIPNHMTIDETQHLGIPKCLMLSSLFRITIVVIFFDFY